VVLHDEKRRCEVMLQRADGSQFPAQLDFLRMDPSGEEPIVHIALTDITERKQAEEEMRIVAVTFETQGGVMVTDPNGVIRRVNKAFSQLTGYSAEEVIGQTPAILSSGRHDKHFYQQMWLALQNHLHWQGEIWYRH
jgi:PAS domain-containing protein